ncbi:MAG TPA: FAD-dependent oxidoreductase [Clostridiales bacterium]|nr:FAD-dependent oxidoreductase [Clostridiales bacterium]
MDRFSGDVVIVGGGCAGVVAAIASARSGAETLLIEKTGVVGGTATNGLVGPFMTCFDPKGKHQIIKGIFDEIVRRMEKRGGAIHPSKTGMVSEYGCWIKLRHNNVTPFEPECLKMVLTELLAEAGVTVHLNTVLTDVAVENNTIKELKAYDGNRYVNYSAKVFIDATGDALLSCKSGVPCVIADVENELQPMTLFFWIYNADDDKIVRFLNQKEETKYLPYHDIIEEARENGEFQINRNKIGLYHMVKSGEWRLNTTRLQGYDPTDQQSMNQAYLEGMKQVQFLMDFLKRLPGLENARIAQTGSIVGIRESRRIQGLYTLTENDLIKNTEFNDTISLCSYPVDLHPSKGALTGTSYKKENTNVADVYRVPYRILLPQKIDNLLVAGKCVSATHEALGAIRIMPSVFAMGEAAGTAAGLAVADEVNPKDVCIPKLQETLIHNGQVLNYN